MIDITDGNQEFVTQENKELFEELKQLGAKEILIMYVGGGDQGEINQVQCSELSEEIINTKHDDLIDLGYQLLDSLFPGWEINEGSEGVIKLVLKNELPSIMIEHGTYYVSFDNYQIKFSESEKEDK